MDEHQEVFGHAGFFAPSIGEQHRDIVAGDPMGKTVYIGNVASHQDAGELERLVSSAGKVLHFKMMLHDDIIRRHGGFAIVELETEDDASKVARTLHGRSFHGTTLEVRPATAPEETASGHPRMFGTMNMGDDPAPPTKP